MHFQSLMPNQGPSNSLKLVAGSQSVADFRLDHSHASTTTNQGATAGLPRAGYWRRTLATLLDTIVVSFPFQLIAAALFAMTAGMVQMESGVFSICNPVKTIPQALSPPPPQGSNFARVCRISFFGAPIGMTLTVGRVTREGTTTKTISQKYMIDANGKPIDGFAIDGIVALALLIYLVAMVSRSGQTIGDRVLRIRVVDVARFESRGVAIAKLIVRFLGMCIGLLPIFALLIYRLVISDGSADAMFADPFFQWFMLTGGLACFG